MSFIIAIHKSEITMFFCDPEDAEHFGRWKWHWRTDKHGRKRYATRQTRAGGKNRTLYLHVEIQKRKGKRRPSRRHRIADHIDGDTLNCHRENLRWATGTMNRNNLNGKAKAWYVARKSRSCGAPSSATSGTGASPRE